MSVPGNTAENITFARNLSCSLRGRVYYETTQLQLWGQIPVSSPVSSCCSIFMRVTQGWLLPAEMSHTGEDSPKPLEGNNCLNIYTHCICDCVEVIQTFWFLVVASKHIVLTSCSNNSRWRLSFSSSSYQKLPSNTVTVFSTEFVTGDFVACWWRTPTPAPSLCSRSMKKHELQNNRRLMRHMVNKEGKCKSVEEFESPMTCSLLEDSCLD